MYKVKLYSEKDFLGYLLKAGSDEHMIYKTIDEAVRAGLKVKTGSSLGVWCRLEKVSEQS